MQPWGHGAMGPWGHAACSQQQGGVHSAGPQPPISLRSTLQAPPPPSGFDDPFGSSNDFGGGGGGGGGAAAPPASDFKSGSITAGIVAPLVTRGGPVISP